MFYYYYLIGTAFSLSIIGKINVIMQHSMSHLGPHFPKKNNLVLTLICTLKIIVYYFKRRDN
ncbi:MAG: hypothetical protein ACJAYJ_001213 [Saprospiraceae bacterium]|jgi:hypothetical protein